MFGVAGYITVLDNEDPQVLMLIYTNDFMNGDFWSRSDLARGTLRPYKYLQHFKKENSGYIFKENLVNSIANNNMPAVTTEFSY